MSESNNRWMIKSGPVWGLPFLIPMCVIIGYGAGWWLDSKLGTRPWLAVILTLVGLAAGIYEFASVLIQASRENDE